MQMRIMVAEFTPGGNATPKVEVFARGGVVVGGDLGFAALMTGSLNTELKTATLTISHGGGWSPVPGVIGTYLTSPQFDGTLQLGVNGICASLAAHAEWTQDIVVQDDNAVEFIRLSAHPTSSAPGATMEASSSSATAASGPFAEIVYKGTAARRTWNRL